MSTFLGWIICICLLPLAILSLVGAMFLLSYLVGTPVMLVYFWWKRGADRRWREKGLGVSSPGWRIRTWRDRP